MFGCKFSFSLLVFSFVWEENYKINLWENCVITCDLFLSSFPFFLLCFLSGLCHNLWRLYYSWSNNFEILRRWTSCARLHVQRTRTIGWIYDLSIWHIYQSTTVFQLSEWIPAGGERAICRYIESDIRKK